MEGISVLMSVYYKESPLNLSQAIESVLNQTLSPSEIVLVKDGPVTVELNDVIATYSVSAPIFFKVIELSENQGLGYALNIGLQNCSYDIVARMDSDDICKPHRFKEQYNFLLENDEIAVLGSNIEEFNLEPGDLKRFKTLPETHEELVRHIRFRSPFNHPSIMFRKQAVIDAGNYSNEILLFEDYTLFLRLMLKGYRFHNLQKSLLFFRVGNGIDTIKRRSGMHYAIKEIKFVLYAVRIGAFTKVGAIVYILAKIPIRLLPSRLVLLLYNKVLRESTTE